MEVIFKSLNTDKTQATFTVGGNTVVRSVASTVGDMDAHLLALAQGLSQELRAKPSTPDTTYSVNDVLVQEGE